MPASPAMVKKFWDCSFMACNNHTEDYNNWKKAMYAGKSFYFCSEACYDDWTEDPSQIGSWSPISEMSTESETTPLKIWKVDYISFVVCGIHEQFFHSLYTITGHF